MGFALTSSWTVCLAFAVLVGFCYFSMTTALNTLLQHLADDEKRGRIMSLFVVTWGGVVPIGAILMGTLADVTSAPFVVACGAGVCLVYALVQLALGFATRNQPSTAPLR
jgi:MFS family permease